MSSISPFFFSIAFILVFLPCPARSDQPPDSCRNSQCKTCAKVKHTARCDFTQWPIYDGRFPPSSNSSPLQCRAACQHFVMVGVQVSRKPSNCTFCQQQQAYDQYAISEGKDGLHLPPQYCIPRGVCQQECGEEPSGCFYTGTCATMLCYNHDPSGHGLQPANLPYDGYGTILRYTPPESSPHSSEHSEEEFTTHTHRPAEVPDIIARGHDFCEQLDAAFQVGAACQYVDQLLEDPRSSSTPGNKQCRSVCTQYVRYEIEMVRKSTNCSLCNSQTAAQYVTRSESGTSICIPREKCAAQCGEEPDGCVYTGSCRSLICYSGMYSKRPALLGLTDSGLRSSITVGSQDGEVDTELDPPVFRDGAHLSSPSPKGADSVTEKENLDPQVTEDDTTEASKWIWMGPILVMALISLLVTIVVGAVVHTGNDNPQDMTQVTSEVEPESVVGR